MSRESNEHVVAVYIDERLAIYIQRELSHRFDDLNPEIRFFIEEKLSFVQCTTFRIVARVTNQETFPVLLLLELNSIGVGFDIALAASAELDTVKV